MSTEPCPGCGRELTEFRGKAICKSCGYHEHCCEGSPQPKEKS